MIKKTSMIFLTKILLVSSVFAQTTNTQETVNPGTTPDSPFYFLDVAMDNLALAMTFNTDAKIQKELEIMSERLAEINAMADKKDVDAVSRAEKEHGSTLEKLERDLKNIEGQNSTEILKKQVIAEKEIKKHKKEVKRVNEELKVKIIINGNPTQEQKELLNSLMDKLAGKTGNVEILLQNEKENSKLKVEKETGKNADELEKEIEQEVDNERPELAEQPEAPEAEEPPEIEESESEDHHSNQTEAREAEENEQPEIEETKSKSEDNHGNQTEVREVEKNKQSEIEETKSKSEDNHGNQIKVKESENKNTESGDEKSNSKSGDFSEEND